ncbi:hypothetical protein ACRAWF_31785 [Streptomyces sp. L7]
MPLPEPQSQIEPAPKTAQRGAGGPVRRQPGAGAARRRPPRPPAARRLAQPPPGLRIRGRLLPARARPAAARPARRSPRRAGVRVARVGGGQQRQRACPYAPTSLSGTLCTARRAAASAAPRTRTPPLQQQRGRSACTAGNGEPRLRSTPGLGPASQQPQDAPAARPPRRTADRAPGRASLPRDCAAPAPEDARRPRVRVPRPPGRRARLPRAPAGRAARTPRPDPARERDPPPAPAPGRHPPRPAQAAPVPDGEGTAVRRAHSTSGHSRAYSPAASPSRPHSTSAWHSSATAHRAERRAAAPPAGQAVPPVRTA